jgi:hypothetical protein
MGRRNKYAKSARQSAGGLQKNANISITLHVHYIMVKRAEILKKQYKI